MPSFAMLPPLPLMYERRCSCFSPGAYAMPAAYFIFAVRYAEAQLTLAATLYYFAACAAVTAL